MAGSDPSGQELLLLASAAALRLAQGRSSGDLSRLAAFFTCLGDNLALLALDAPSGSTGPLTAGDE